MYEFEQLAAALYFAAGVGALLGLVLPAPRMLRGARIGLALGAAVQTCAFATLHRLDPAPSLADLGQAVAVMSWLGAIFLLLLSLRLKLPGFIPPIAFLAFVGAFWAAAEKPLAEISSDTSGSIPHAHVLLASSGLAALGLAGLAGLFYLIEHRQLKQRKRAKRRIPLPSLEALDRVNRTSLALGFPLLSLGLVTGSLWLHARTGRVFSGSIHETWTLVAWLIYVGLVSMRFIGRQGARQAAASATVGFAFLLVAVLGSGLVS